MVISVDKAVNAFGKEFNEVFGLDLKDYLIPELAKVNIGILNITSLDDWLMEKYSDYTDGISMAECIETHYGEKGVKLIKKMIDLV